MENNQNQARCAGCEHLLSFHNENGCTMKLLGIEKIPLYGCGCKTSVSLKPKSFPKESKDESLMIVDYSQKDVLIEELLKLHKRTASLDLYHLKRANLSKEEIDIMARKASELLKLLTNVNYKEME